MWCFFLNDFLNNLVFSYCWLFPCYLTLLPTQSTETQRFGAYCLRLMQRINLSAGVGWMNRSLLYAGFEVFQKLDIMSILEIDDATVIKFLSLIESNYVNSITYHNSTHACDVMQSCAFICSQGKLMVGLRHLFLERKFVQELHSLR